MVSVQPSGANNQDLCLVSGHMDIGTGMHAYSSLSNAPDGLQ